MHSKRSTMLPFLFALSGVLAAPMPQVGPGMSCSSDGQRVCSGDGMKIYVCNWGKLVPDGSDGSVPAGTMCVDGRLATLKGGAGASQGGSSEGPVQAPAPAPITTPSPPPPSTGAGAGGQTGGGQEGSGSGSGTGTGGGRVSGPEQPEEPTISTITQSITMTMTRSSVETATREPIASRSLDDSGAANIGIPTSSAQVQPTTAPSEPPASGGGDSAVTAEQVLAAAPKSGSCATTGEFAKECRTNVQAAKFISDSFAKYKINTVNEKAALLSLMAFETGNFQFERNHFPTPGRPGQGTRNLMMPNFVFEYAKSIPSVASKLATAAPGIETPDQAMAANPDIKNAVLALVLPDELSFASAAWFYTAHCSDAAKSALKTDGEKGWEGYLTGCVGTGLEGRQDGYQLALNALSGK